MDRKNGGMRSGMKHGDGAYESVIHGKTILSSAVRKIHAQVAHPDTVGRQSKSRVGSIAQAQEELRQRRPGSAAAYGTSTVRSPGLSAVAQIFSTSVKGIVFVVTAMAPALISSTSDGSSAR
jgi:hypothetical protein